MALLHMDICSSGNTLRFWYGCEKCCHFLPNFFYSHKRVSFDPNSESLEEPEVIEREIWRMPWLVDGWNLFIIANHCTVRDMSQGTISWYRILLFLHALNDMNQSIRKGKYVCYTKQPSAPTDQDVGGPPQWS